MHPSLYSSFDFTFGVSIFVFYRYWPNLNPGVDQLTLLDATVTSDVVYGVYIEIDSFAPDHVLHGYQTSANNKAHIERLIGIVLELDEASEVAPVGVWSIAGMSPSVITTW